ncbi:baculoviral IAP repeat-containing protein 1a-like [Peromyscus leucopus]|uniref:baculoviral IAP repeat-containing protein 1a-like n=1 Tax=Peromyscus leucopus TaxID=10041 RepID=UPI001884D7B5|nr:baculoviral IAP repeat-containing protein 1a-like [Peromyscus leucopus]
MATHGEASEERISEIDYEFLPELSALLGVDAVQFAKSLEEEDHQERVKMKKGFNSHMRSEAKRLKTFVTYDTFRSWTPQEMAAAGFYFTGVKLGVQCFCCSLILFGTSLRKTPVENHRRLRPGCEFLLGKDVGNIGKYDIRVKSPEKLRGGKARYQEEEARLESFENWPFYAHGTSPRVLSAAGFVFTGKRDTVQCFSCGGCLGNWEEGDDPWKEHAKWFPNSEYPSSFPVKLIQNSPNLQVFYLKCDFFLNCESLMTVLASCKKLREIEFSGRCFEAMPFVTILPNFVALKILKLGSQQFPDKETSEKFAQALGSLRNLEELLLPSGDGIHHVAKLIVRQCLQLRCLRVLAFHYTLDDDSVMEIAKGATSGGFQKLETLDLSMNHKITEEGYRHFFQALDNLPNLQMLNISRHLPESIQVQATTVKALGQCVSRLPSLTILQMFSWLLDEEDMKVINAVKERHPQSRRLTVFWKWIVPFSPVIQK